MEPIGSTEPGESCPPPRLSALAPLADELRAIAGTGLHYATSDYDRARYQRVLAIAAELAGALFGLPTGEAEARFAREVGYVTPKVGVAAAIYDDRGRLLLIQRPDSGLWCPPVGWCEVGEAPATGIVREVEEETGLVVRPERLLGVYDSRRQGSRGPHHFYSLAFVCSITGGVLARTAEADDLGYFELAELPPLVPHLRGLVEDGFVAWREGWREARFDE